MTEWYLPPVGAPDVGARHERRAAVLLDQLRAGRRNLRALSHSVIEPYGEAKAAAVLCRLVARDVELADESEGFVRNKIIAFRGPHNLDLVLLDGDLAVVAEAKAARVRARFGTRINRDHDDLAVPLALRRALSEAASPGDRRRTILRLGAPLTQGTREYVEEVLLAMAQPGKETDVDRRRRDACIAVKDALDSDNCLFLTVESRYGPALVQGGSPRMLVTIHSSDE